VGGTNIDNAIHHDYRACHVFPLRYDCLRHVQQIPKCAFLKDPHNWNNRTVEELEEVLDCDLIVCKYNLCYFLCGAAAKLRSMLTVDVRRPPKQLDTQKHTVGSLRTSENFVE